MIRILANDYFVTLIATSNDPGLLHLLSSVKNIQKGRKRDEYFTSLRNLPEILQICRPQSYATRDFPEAILRYLDEETARRERTSLLKKLGPDMTSDWLWPHQCLGIELSHINRRYAFYYDTRTGKTLMSLKIMYDALKAGRAKRCLVVCPSSIVQAWLGDAAEHFPELKVVAYYGDNREEALTKPAHIIIWSMSLLHSTLPMLLATHFDICFVDESSKIKSHKAQLSEDILTLSLHIPSWYLLSATPAPNNHSEYYIQIKTIDPYAFNATRTHFVEKYFNNISRNNNYEKLVLRREMEAEFMSIIESYAIYVDQGVMPTAGKEWLPLYYEMPNDIKKVYNEMRTEMATEIDGVPFTVDMAAAVRFKLSQIASGFILDTSARKENKISLRLGEIADRQETYLLNEYKVKVLLDLLSRFPNEKVVIWATFKAEFEMLQKALGPKARCIRGGCSVADKEQYIKEFKHGSLQYIIGHPLSIGMGINLTEAHISVYFSFNDSWEAFKQSSERIAGHIKVQPLKCQYYIMIANDSINGIIFDNLQNKRDMSTGVYEHLRAGALKYV